MIRCENYDIKTNTGIESVPKIEAPSLVIECSVIAKSKPELVIVTQGEHEMTKFITDIDSFYQHSRVFLR